jgi:hypothetical protein
MNNQVETVQVEGGTVSFDHATGVMRAKWDNGYTETWSNRYGMAAHRDAFYRFTDQWERVSK